MRHTIEDSGAECVSEGRALAMGVCHGREVGVTSAQCGKSVDFSCIYLKKKEWCLSVYFCPPLPATLGSHAEHEHEWF